MMVGRSQKLAKFPQKKAGRDWHHPPRGEAAYETFDERATGFRCRH
jgi:hypothetical protein